MISRSCAVGSARFTSVSFRFGRFFGILSNLGRVIGRDGLGESGRCMVDGFAQVEVAWVWRDTVGLHSESTRVGFGTWVNKVGEATGRVERDAEMSSKWRTKSCGACVWVDLIIDQTPLFQESVNPHDRTNITCQVPPTRGDREILPRIEPVRIDHKVTIVLINGRRFAPVSAGEEFR